VKGREGRARLHRSDNAANYAALDPAQGRVDFLFARRPYAREMLARAQPRPVLGEVAVRVVDPADRIGLKVQSSANDPRRHRRDMEDVARLLERAPELDLERVREYFRLRSRAGARCAARGGRAMSRPPQAPAAASLALREMLEDALCPAVREDFARSLRAQQQAQRSSSNGLEAALVWVAELRELFGDPPVDPSPWPERVPAVIPKRRPPD
jgi:hypothetical protein